jgi:predicted amidohydrolase
MFSLIMSSQQKKEESKVKIASLSFVPVKWDKEVNLKTIEIMAREAAAHGARIIVTSEGAVEGYLINEVNKGKNRADLEQKFIQIAEPIDGPALTKMQNLAMELRVDMIIGFLERDKDVLYNSCAWIDSLGAIRHVHRKTHMAQPYFVPKFYHPGSKVEAFDTDLGRFGMMICYERQVPEVPRALALDGAQILFNPSYGSRGEWNDIMLRTRARDNNSYLIFTHPLQSLFIDPKGRIIRNIIDKEGITYAVLEIGKADREKLSKRRPKVFIDKLSGKIVNKSGKEQD